MSGPCELAWAGLRGRAFLLRDVPFFLFFPFFFAKQALIRLSASACFEKFVEFSSQREREFCELNSGKIQGVLQVIKMQSVEGKNSMRFLQLWHCEL